jgi:NitT/TauT family transport system substrate-binding protein
VALAVVALAGCGHTRVGAPNPQVRVALSRDAISFLPVHLAQSLGCYQQEGLAVTLSEFNGLSKGVEALLGGSAEVAGGTSVPIQMAAEGRSLQGFLVMYTSTSLVLIVSPAASGKVHTIADLKGRRVGVSASGSPTHFFLNYVLVKNGMQPADVSVISIGTGPTSLAAIEHDAVNAAVMVGGPVNMLERAHPGLTFLADARKPASAQRIFGSASFPGGLLVAQEGWLKANPDTARRLVRAVRKAMQWMSEHSPEQIRAQMREDQRMTDAAADLDTIREYQQTLSADGAMPEGGPEIMYKVLATSIDKVRTAQIDLSKLYTNEYLSGKRCRLLRSRRIARWS